MNRWSTAASLTLFAGALGHFMVVDLSAWIMEAGYVQWAPSSLLLQARSTIMDWGFIGDTTFFKAFAGFSLWVVVSLTALATYNLLIFRALPPGHLLRMKSLTVGLVTSVIFLMVATFCFIQAAAAGGALAVAFFVLAIRKEKNLAAGSLKSVVRGL